MRTLVLPGMDGTGLLLQEFAAALPAELGTTVVSFPPDLPAGYAELEMLVEKQIPTDGPFALVAESFSGPLALRLAGRHAGRLRGVVLAASFASSPRGRLVSALRAFVGSWLFRLPPPRSLIRRYLVGDDAAPKLVDAAASAITRVRPAVFASRLRAVLGCDETAAFTNCPAPILYLAAARDRVVSTSTVRRLLQIRSDIRLETIDAPHLVLEMEPLAAARVIAEFLAGCAGPRQVAI